MEDEDRATAYLFDPGDAGVQATAREPIAEGTFAECAKAVWALPASDRERAYIATAGWTYVPDELESMKGEDEGEI